MTNNGKHPPRGGLEKEQLEELIARGLTIRGIARELDRSPTTIRYWLDKHGIESRRIRAGRQRVHGSADQTDSRIESRCDRHGHTEFALRAGGYYRCLACGKEAVIRWRRKAKLILIEEAGGACLLCGFDDVPAALEFHHIDPREKLSYQGRWIGLS